MLPELLPLETPLPYDVVLRPEVLDDLPLEDELTPEDDPLVRPLDEELTPEDDPLVLPLLEELTPVDDPLVRPLDDELIPEDDPLVLPLLDELTPVEPLVRPFEELEVRPLL